VVSALPPAHGVCEHAAGRNSGAGRCVGGRTHPIRAFCIRAADQKARLAPGGRRNRGNPRGPYAGRQKPVERTERIFGSRGSRGPRLFRFRRPETYPQPRMADCDYRRGLLARNAAVIAMRSDCDERRQPFDRYGLAKHRARLRHDATNALSALARRLLNPSHGNPGAREP
jgi:hypothetical protein